MLIQVQRDQPHDEAEDPVVASVLRLPEVHDVAARALEAGLDAIVENSALDAIPVVASVRALARGVVAFHDAWLTKKLAALMFGVGEASDRDVERWRARLDEDGGTRETGERVLALVDGVTSLWKAELLGRLFRLYLDGGCSRVDYLTTAEMVHAALTEDLRFLLHDWDEGADSERCRRLIAVGLMKDRSSSLLLESSQPPTTSNPGHLLVQVAK